MKNQFVLCSSSVVEPLSIPVVVFLSMLILGMCESRATITLCDTRQADPAAFEDGQRLADFRKWAKGKLCMSRVLEQLTPSLTLASTGECFRTIPATSYYIRVRSAHLATLGYDS